MGTIIRRLLAALLVTAVVWFAVVLYWQVEEVNPSAGDLALWLLGLPLALLGGFLLLRWGLRRRAARATTPSVAADEESSPSPIDSGPQPDRIVHLLAGAVWLRAGAGGAAVAESLAKPERPPLHSRLKDSLGLPAFAAAVEDLDPAAVEASLRSVMVGSERFEQVFDEESLRALALLDPVAEELLLAALPPTSPEAAMADRGSLHTEPTLHPHAMHHSRSARASASVAMAAAVVRVRLLLPANWTSAARQVAGDWLRAKAVALGFAPQLLEVEVLPATNSGDTWRTLDQLIQAQARDRDHDPQLLLAAHSAIGDASIERLDARRELLVSGHPEGLIPGEGAAGLLLAGAHIASDPAAPAPLRLHRLLRGQSGSGRGASRQAAELLQHAMTTAAQPAESIALVFSDADHRPSRAIEIAGAIAATLPELDPVDDARHLGLACGDLGAVAPLALLAAAAAHAAQSEAPVLAFGLADPRARVALVLSPLPALDADSQTPDSAEAASAVAATA